MRAGPTVAGYSLIELVIFIVVIGILGVGLMSAFSGALLGATEPERITRATVLAQERMELILGRREAAGFAAFTAFTFDPSCTNVPAGYTITSNLATDWNGDTGYKVVTVSVAGAGTAQLSVLTGDY